MLECIPTLLANKIEESIDIPTISVGAGHNTTGHNINAYDLLGMFDSFVPKFVKQYANLGEDMVNAYNQWCEEIDNGIFPGPEHGYKMNSDDIPD
ncbi:3-methyl-2-oxobutanoate hydroxymethyltransferase [Miniphocaeibacter halophilus]|uniref:3-methyl-2-oxobutanoate hydroxymethyltransferase n=1 Tax=Miniphocaeibacter halophilus TaxID=2931922 RepID=UPI0021E16576|nr:3-methyl-2-oxobutanoate hydroxymethyltransferase [Miniphocaeibacter halophilus]